MSAHRPTIVVSLPARTLVDARRQVEEAGAAGADLAEVRFDRWSPEERERVAELFPSPIPLVATLRSRAEGGEGPDDADAREIVLRDLSHEPFAYIDLEAARDRRLEEPFGALDPHIIRSSHLPTDASGSEVEARLREAPPDRGIVKVVLPASFSRAIGELIPQILGRAEPRPVLLTTGPSGSLWRAWAGRLGIPWVFASLPEGSSPETVEASQIPVDRFSAFLGAADAPIFAVLGHPVDHSRSPKIHQRWMRRSRYVGLYLGLDLSSSDEFHLAIDLLPSRGFLGVNVTHPWKHLAYECAGWRSADALATGTANCLTFREGRIEAENTDLGAMSRRLTELKETALWSGTDLTVLGGGGAARATLAAAQRIGAAATVFTRRPSEAKALATEFDAWAGDPLHPEPAQLVVHATDVGRAGTGALELPLRELLSARSYVLDWVYDPALSTVAAIAGELAAKYEDGRRLLVYQAAASFRQWWGQPPDAESVEESLREVGCTA
jgi:shikimate dehydrogenase